MTTVTKEYIAKRGIAKGSLTRLVNYADSVSERTLTSEIVTRLDLLEKVFNDFCEHEAKLAVHDVPSEMVEYEAKYLNVKTKLNQFLVKPKEEVESSGIEKMMSRVLKEQNEFLINLSSTFTSSLNQTVSQSLDEPHCSVRLPRLNVPAFSGDYREFASFKDLYTATVHCKIVLTDAEKFQYLRGYLRDEAADLLKHIPVSEANYNQAWQKLCERYDKPKYVLNSLIKRFIEQPSLQTSSVTKLRQLFNNIDDVNRGIDALGGEAKNRDPWLIYLLLNKTDHETQKAWAYKTVNKEFPSFEELLTFISERCDALESCESPRQIPSRSQPARSHQLKSVSNIDEECLLCKDVHKLHQCDEFKKLNSIDRREQAAKLYVCFNCLSPRHRASQCLSQRNCSKCGRRHHTLLHSETIANNDTLSDKSLESTPLAINKSTHDKKPNASSLDTVLTNTSKIGGTILPTAIVKVKNQYGQITLSNVLLDSGSQISFISQKCVKQLGLRCSSGRLRVEGLATSNVNTLGKTTLQIYSQFNMMDNLTINAFVLPTITTLPASPKINPDEFNQLAEIPLADIKFHKRKEIDILLGADYFFHILRNNQIELINNMIARETLFGYVVAGVSGHINPRDEIQRRTYHINIIDEQCLDETLRKFWEQEELTDTKPWTTEEEACESHFVSTYRRNQEGRFIVKLPLKSNVHHLGQSYKVAFQRLLAMERKFNRNLDYKLMYHKFMDEYLTLGHMRLVHQHDSNDQKRQLYFLPHHGVLKETSSTTKLRVVFDGSAVTSNGISLNDTLMVGPTLQESLWTIIVRFRRFKVALTADIEKMYRQILIDPSQTSLQRILWRRSASDAVDQYELATVTYGTSAAPYLAVRVLTQVAEDCKVDHPTVSNIIKNNFYVDDLLTGAESEGQAESLKKEISEVLTKSGFVLRKWQSNLKKLSDTDGIAQIAEEQTISTMLGLYWNSERDEFSFRIIAIPFETCTKRVVLSISARIFDPLGWLIPFTINVKLFMQQLWLRKVTWDETLPHELQENWKGIHGQFQFLNSVTIDRYLGSISHDIQFHGFSDASESAYAAAIYVRVKTEGKYLVSLVTAKSKVAPLNQISLPRLELCGAHLLTKLMRKVLIAYDLEDTGACLWTDSMIVLAWLSNHPRRWKTYVANRVSAIHTLLPHAAWRHVTSKENPADLATRGIKAHDLVNNELWFKGPEWLSSTQEMWPVKTTIIDTLQETRSKEVNLFHALVKLDTIQPIPHLIARFSKWSQLIRSMAYVLRFIHNRTSNQKLSSSIKIDELHKAEMTIIRYIQQTEFAEDIQSLTKFKRVASSSKLRSLAPFIDSENTLRVGGRLHNSHCTYEMKHPIVLPRDHPVTTMILQSIHTTFLHPGPTLLTALSRHKYWILGVRGQCRKLCHKCTTCFRFSTLRSTQQMGTLPHARITPSRPFSIVGVDYAGPILLASKRGRGAKLIKGFIVVFVCFATKAIHIEMASDLTTDAFLAALDRFVARRGAPTEVFSDNGSNFIGARRILHQHYKLLNTAECKSHVNAYATNKRIKWNLIPPISPHFGGIWERAIRSIKTHLIKLVGNAHLTYEEMGTLLVQIEGVLNSRPLCAIKNEDACNIDVLTPAHFLTLGPITALPHADYQEIAMSRLNRWEQIQKLVQTFWHRYTSTYLNTLQQRTKWQLQNPNLKIDDVVLIQNSNSPPCSWQLGRITELHPGTDGLVRVATVQTQAAKFKRPIAKLYRLPLED